MNKIISIKKNDSNKNDSNKNINLKIDIDIKFIEN